MDQTSTTRARDGAPGGDRPRPAADDPLVGRLLDGRYLVGPRIARGGMASVHVATDTRLDRTVAVKVMHPGLGDGTDFAARFVREARAAARLTHPNVVAVFDQGEDDGTVFLAMEHVPGTTLRDLVSREAPVRPERALALLEPVLSALAAAHRAGVVHRDVKPENVLLAEDGRVKVADFGLAKAVSADTQHTATGGVLIGTVSYLAPELVVEGRADTRADVYAAGVVLFELLTGRKPHEGESPIQVAWKHVHEDVPAPSTLVPGLPPYVDALVARFTARDRGLRPADAGVALHQLRRVATALHEGLDDDPDLTADLRLPPPVEPAEPAEPAEPTVSTEPVEAEADERRESTAPIAPLLAPTVAAWPPPAADGATTVVLDRSGGTAPPPSAGTPAAARRPRRRRRGPVLLAVLLLLVGAVGVGAWWFGVGRWTSTPAVIGLTQAAATERLEAVGLDVAVGDPAYSETVPVGQVVDTDPGAGERVLDGGTVELVLSLGPERYDVPRLRGLTEDRAQDRLLDTNLEPGPSEERYSETVPEGRVITTVPEAGTTLRPGTEVRLVVSLGREPIEVPDLVGDTLRKAERVLDRRGLEVSTTEEFSDGVPEGRIISQSPRDGTLFRGDPVQLVVSLGPELVEVPGGLVASGVEAATEELEALGFDVEVRNDDDYIGLGFVFRVEPGSGTLVPRGSTVTLYLI